MHPQCKQLSLRVNCSGPLNYIPPKQNTWKQNKPNPTQNNIKFSRIWTTNCVNRRRKKTRRYRSPGSSILSFSSVLSVKWYFYHITVYTKVGNIISGLNINSSPGICQITLLNGWTVLKTVSFFPYPDAVAVKNPSCAQNLRLPGRAPPGLTARLPSGDGCPSPMLAHRDNEEWKITLKRLERSTTGQSTTCLWSRWPEQAGATPPLMGCLKPDLKIAREPRYHESLLSEVYSSLPTLKCGCPHLLHDLRGATYSPLETSQVFGQPPLAINALDIFSACGKLLLCLQHGGRVEGVLGSSKCYLISFSTSNSTHCCSTQVIWQVR